MAVFALGIVILVFVFAIAYGTFTSPASDVLGTGPGPLTAPGLGGSLVMVLVRVLLLFVMTLAGSLIASRGIQLYLGGGERTHPAAREDETPRQATSGGSSNRPG
jgi:hypothetical protein